MYKRWISLMLILGLLLSLVPAASAAPLPPGPLRINDLLPLLPPGISNIIPPFPDQPEPNQPEPNQPAPLPPFPTDPASPFIPNQPAPSQPAPDESGGTLRVRAFVDRTEAKTAEPLIFIATASGGRGQRKYALRIFRDGESVAYLSTGSTSQWIYTPDYPGTYYGQVSVSDSQSKIASDRTPDIAVTLNDKEALAQRNAPLGMGGGNPSGVDHFLELDHIPNLTILENQPMRLPFNVCGDPMYEELLWNKKTQETALSVSGLPRSFHIDYKRGQGRVYPAIVYNSTPYVVGNYWTDENVPDETIENAVKKIGKTAPEDDKNFIENAPWRGDELEITFEATVTAKCNHGTGAPYDAMSVSSSFNVTLLRDRNHNGIPDRDEPWLAVPSNIAFFALPVVEMNEIYCRRVLATTFPSLKIQLFRKATGNITGNYKIWAKVDEKDLPNGMRFEKISAGRFPYYLLDGPSYRFTGFPKIQWGFGEVRRSYPIRIQGRDSMGNETETTLLLIVNRWSDNNWQADYKLSINPVPVVSITDGKAAQSSVPISVTTNSNEPVTITMKCTNSSYNEEMGCPFTLVQGGHNRVDDSPALPDGIRRISAWALKYNPNFDRKWYKKTQVHICFLDLAAQQGNRHAYRRVRVKIVRTRSNGVPVTLMILPIADQWTFQGEPMKPVKVELIGPNSGNWSQAKIKNVTLIKSPSALRGVRYDSTTKTISGNAYVNNWRKGELWRTYTLTIQGEIPKPHVDVPDDLYFVFTQPEDSIASTSFQLTVYRKLSDIDQGGFLPMISQEIMEGDPVTPFIFRSKPGDVPFVINSEMSYLPGVQRYPDGYYRGIPVVNDWKEGENKRTYAVTATGSICLSRHSAGRVSSIYPNIPVQSVTQEITVIRSQNTMLNAAPPDAGGIVPPPIVHTPVLPERAGPDTGKDETEHTPDEKPESAPEAHPADTSPDVPPDAPPADTPPADGALPPQDGEPQTGQAGTALPEQELPNSFREIAIEDLTGSGPAFTDAQRTLPRLGIALHDAGKEAGDGYQGILTALLHAGYRLNENIVVVVTNANHSDKKAAEDIQLLADMGCRPIIAVGETMARIARTPLKDIPLIAAGVADPQAAGFTDRNMRPRSAVSGVITPPVINELLKMIQRMQPEPATAGIMHMLPLEKSRAYRGIASDNGLGFEQVLLRMESSMTAMAGKLFGKVDFLVLDASIKPLENLIALEALTNACIESRTPLYGTSVLQARGGAAAAVTTDFFTVGVHAGQLAASVLQGANITDLPFVQATDICTEYNNRTLAAFGLKNPDYALSEGDAYEEIEPRVFIPEAEGALLPESIQQPEASAP